MSTPKRNGGAKGKTPEIVRYHPSQLRVEKHEAKKTGSTIFCGTRKREEKPTRSNSDEVAETSDIGSSAPSTPRSLSTSDQQHSTMTPQLSSRLYHRFAIPEVHGQKPSSSKAKGMVNAKVKLSQEVAALNFRKSAIDGLTSSQRADLAKLRGENFELKRENVNLKGQIDSLQSHQKSFSQPLQSVAIATELLQKSASNSDQEFRAKLRSAHDEIYRLQTEETQRRVEIQKVQWQVKELQRKLDLSFKDKSEAVLRADELQNKLDKLSSSMLEGEREESLKSILQNDNESLRKSKQWFEDQLKAAQASKRELESELTSTKEEMWMKTSKLAELQYEMEQNTLMFQTEKRRFENEKDDCRVKLEKIEAEMKDQEAQLDMIQGEKDRLISDLTSKLSEASSVDDVSKHVKELESEMESLKNLVSDKDTIIKDLEKVISHEKEHERELKNEVEKLTLTCHQLEEQLTNVDQDLKNNVSMKTDLSLKLKEALADLKSTRSQVEKLESDQSSFDAKIDEMEAELLEKHEAFDALMAKKTVLDEQYKQLAKVTKDQDQKLKDIEDKKNELERMVSQEKTRADELSAKNIDLQTTISRLEVESRQSVSPVPEVSYLQTENLALKQRIQQLEQCEIELPELQQQVKELEASKSELKDKLLEYEKVNEEEIESLSSIVMERNELIDQLKSNLEVTQQELELVKQAFENSQTERQRFDSEKAKRVEDLEEALEDYESKKKQLVDKEAALDEALDKLVTIQDDNDSLTDQVQKYLTKMEALDLENSKLRQSLEDAREAALEMQDVHLQRINRLESFVAEYEKELEEMTRAQGQLQNQIITLEAANGKLQSEHSVNETLKEQLHKVQEDLRNDQDLRSQLVQSLQMARESLGDEISTLETSLKEEKQHNLRAKEMIFRLENENLELQKEVNSLQLNSDDLREEVSRLRMSSSNVRACDDDKAQQTQFSREVRELEAYLEEKNRSLASLEDHVATLKFQVKAKDKELDEVKKLLAMSNEKHESIVDKFRESESSLRKDFLQQSQLLQTILDERNHYRVQVQQMNLALKNSLDHIKHLRSRASCPASPSPPFDVMPPSPSKQNLTNLQECLSSLKSEMALLQTRLAPAESQRQPSGWDTTTNGDTDQSSPEPSKDDM